MILFAAMDTSIFGKAYHQGQQVDDTDWIRAQYLQMFDLGLITSATGTQVLNGPEVMVLDGPYVQPYAPSMPLLAEAPHGYQVTWDGKNADGIAANPPDWAWVEIHASVLGGFEPVSATLQGTFTAPTGGSQVCIAGLEYSLGISDTYEVLLMHRSTTGSPSLPSQRASIVVGQIAEMDIADFSITVKKQQSLRHLLY